MKSIPHKPLRSYAFDTLVETLQFLGEYGYTREFVAEKKGIRDKFSGTLFKPRQIMIDGKYRFEGASNPSDNVEVLAVRTEKGTKGTIVLSYGAKQSQDADMIRML